MIYRKKQYMSRWISQPWTNFLHAGLLLSHRSSWISRPDKIYQNSWQQTFYWYMAERWQKKWQRGSTEFQKLARIVPRLPISLQLALNPEKWVCINLQKHIVYYSSHLATLNIVFGCRIAVLWLLKLNIKARHYIPESVTASLQPVIDTRYHEGYRLEFTKDIDWRWNIFT